MFQIQTKDKKVALATVLTYWVFRCRDVSTSPAMGLKTWTYLQSSIKNSATPAKNLNDYIENLSNKLVVPTLKPKEWTRIIDPKVVVRRVSDLEIQELNDDQINLNLKFISWESVLQSFASEGITDRHILERCKTYPHVITTFVRVKHEEEKELIENDNLEYLEVEAHD